MNEGGGGDGGWGKWGEGGVSKESNVNRASVDFRVFKDSREGFMFH